MFRHVLAAGLLSLVAVGAQAREGFGFTKRAAEMIIRRPPAIALSGTRFQVTASSDRARNTEDANALRTMVEKAILAGDPRMTTEGNPQIEIAIVLGQLDVDQHSESRVEDESVKTKDKDGKTHYDTVKKTKYITVVRANLSGTFKITDSHGGVYDSGDIDDHYSKDFEYSTPDSARISNDLLVTASRKIAGRVVPTSFRQKVLIPKGSFEAAAPLAESNSWDQYLAAVEAVAPMRDLPSEAFRQYALGVAKEGLAHSTDDKAHALTLLREAAGHYQAAVTDNPQEKLFSEKYTSLLNSAVAPLERVQRSLTEYDAWVHAVPARPQAAEPVARSARAHGKTMRNREVVEMVRAGLADDNIVTAIDSADQAEFDTSADALIALSKAGVSNAVIRAMQNRH